MSFAVENIAQHSERVLRNERRKLKLFAFSRLVSQENQEDIYPLIRKPTELEKKSEHIKIFPSSNKP